jgi:hypothetical protein
MADNILSMASKIEVLAINILELADNIEVLAVNIGAAE